MPDAIEGGEDAYWWIACGGLGRRSVTSESMGTPSRAQSGASQLRAVDKPCLPRVLFLTLSKSWRLPPDIQSCSPPDRQSVWGTKLKERASSGLIEMCLKPLTSRSCKPQKTLLPFTGSYFKSSRLLFGESLCFLYSSLFSKVPKSTKTYHSTTQYERSNADEFLHIPTKF